MSSVHHLPDNKNWICFYRDRTGRRRCKSTGTTSKREADRICNEIEKLEAKGNLGRITVDRARKIIETTVADILESTGAKLESVSIKTHFESWSKARELETSTGTWTRYSGIVASFLKFLGHNRNRPLSSLTSQEVQAYRDSLAGKVSSGTVNVHLKVLRVCLERAVKQCVFDRNPARLVDNLAQSDKHHRRPFTMEELKKLLAVANDEWRTMVTVALYTGLRLGDCAGLTWNNVDLATCEITLQTQKTSRVQILPIAAPLQRLLEKLPSSDDPQAPLCPGLNECSPSNLSEQFHGIMASAGLVKARDHTKQKHGRNVRREQNKISFHSLRHSATSFLKNAGVSDAIARDIVGHESEVVSRNYTHIDTTTKRAAVDKLPDIFKA